MTPIQLFHALFEGSVISKRKMSLKTRPYCTRYGEVDWKRVKRGQRHICRRVDGLLYASYFHCCGERECVSSDISISSDRGYVSETPMELAKKVQHQIVCSSNIRASFPFARADYKLSKNDNRRVQNARSGRRGRWMQGSGGMIVLAYFEPTSS